MENLSSFSSEVNTTTLIAFIAYLSIMVLVGIIATKFSSAGINNFFIGGRKMSKLVVAISSVVSGRSAWLLLGVTGMAYTMGISALWATFGYILAEFWLFFSYAPRIRRFSEKHDCITIPDFFAERFNDKSGVLRMVIVFIILLFMIAYLSAQFVAGGKTFSTSFPVTENTGLLITAGIILLYTVLGGFLAVSLTDTIQGIIMSFALLALPILAIINLGGINEFWSLAKTAGDGSHTNIMAIGAGALIGFLGIGLGSAGNPHIVARYMSINKTKNLKSVAFIGTITNILMALGAVFTGLAGRIYFPEIAALPDADPENIYPVMAAVKFHPIVFGIIISSIFAAIMSTADSQLLVAASSAVRDIYQKLIKKDLEIPQKKLVNYSRITIIILVILALLLGFIAKDLIFWLVLFAWAGLGAALGPTSILALFWKKTTKQGIIAGVITGAVTVIIWNQVPALKSIVYELIPGFIFATIATIVVSFITASDIDYEDKYNDCINENEEK
ncbi:MAG: sodium/proline symporter [Marinilabiliales bacterium]|nr:MAG: sodium/proline symporter [Marinilabiliales bacterium]